MSRRRFFKSEARKLLFSEWLLQILLFMTVGAVFYGIWQFGLALGLSVNELISNEKTAILVISVFGVFAASIFVPTAYGLLMYEVDFVETGKSNPSHIFKAFSSAAEYFRSMDLFFGIVLRNILYFLPAIALGFFNAFVYPYTISHSLYFEGIDVVMFLLRTLLVIFFYLGIVLSSTCFTASYIAVKTDKEISECFYEAAGCLRKNRVEALNLALSFFPLFVLSIFTVVFLFVMYTIPYMYITFVMFSKYLYEKRVLEIQNMMTDKKVNINEIQ